MAKISREPRLPVERANRLRKRPPVCSNCVICSNCSASVRFGITRQELTVIRLVCDGFSNDVIADELIISVWTVKRHITNIFDKCGVGSRTKLMIMAIRHGWVKAPLPEEQ